MAETNPTQSKKQKRCLPDCVDFFDHCKLSPALVSYIEHSKNKEFLFLKTFVDITKSTDISRKTNKNSFFYVFFFILTN